ncbi:MAG: DUF1553 domain-containing protein [Pirellula sp.]
MFRSLLCSTLFLVAAHQAAQSDDNSFRIDIQPILTKHCASCHTGQDAQGGFDLSTKQSALQGKSPDQPIVPFKSADSKLVELISGDQPEMPKNGERLSQVQIESIKRWIDSGAPWPDGVTVKADPLSWWSLQPIVTPSLPSLTATDAAWARTPIDVFTLAKMRAKGLTPNPPADRRTLIRRLSYDLTGLPPSFERVQEFERDERPDAYERLVEEFLASPRYGERWAQHWLDVVHYGETHGYDKDKVRPNAWPYRDYVIRAFNSDKPYQNFVEEQIAGDVLHPNTVDGTVGLGFIAAGPFDYVGQIEVKDGTLEKQRVRNIDRDDMVSVTMNAITSVTAQCARCHDHKFDPISQEDYYRLQAVFAGVDRADRPWDAEPTVRAKREELTLELKQLQSRRSALDSEMHRMAGSELKEIDRQMEESKKLANTPQKPQFGYHSAIETKSNISKWVQVDLGMPQPIAQIQLAGAHDDFAGIGAGFGFPVRYRIDVSDDGSFDDFITIADHSKQDVRNPGVTPVSIQIKGTTARFIRVTAIQLAKRQNDHIFALAELMAFSDDGKNLAFGASVSALDSIEAPLRWAKSNLVDGVYPGASSSDTESVIAVLKARREELIRQRVDGGTLAEQQQIEKSVQNISSQIAKLPQQQMVFVATSEFKAQGNFTATQGKPRPIHVLDRGDEASPKQRIGDGAIGCLPSHPVVLRVDSGEREDTRRSDLARWLVHPDNYLTWRSIVNRVWSYHFGRGIVDTTNDFGRMGSLPTHPELLDWLAENFRDSGQSIKDLHRWIVCSATYRQSSDHRDAYAKIDSDNRYLWRMSRHRLEAEAIRDSVLHVSGRLRLEVGGPSFRPFRFEDDHSPRYLYQDSDPNDALTHRRSIYRMIVRSVPDPWMSALDCADPSISVDRRNETLTALQSLSLLNNPFMVRMSEHFAHQASAQESTESSAIAAVFRSALQREPTAEEVQILLPILQKHGLANVCRIVLNSNEFVFAD